MALIIIHREGRRERGVADELMEQEKTREHFKKEREKKRVIKTKTCNL